MTLKAALYLLWECFRMLKKKQLVVATASFVTAAVASIVLWFPFSFKVSARACEFHHGSTEHL